MRVGATRLLMMVSVILFSGYVAAQQRPPQGPPPPPRQGALIDLTGYWVAIVDQDWRWRMLTAPIGDAAGIPVNAEGRRVARAWNPAADEAAGIQCKAYGAAGLMRLPTRLHIHWADDQTLQVDTDAGQQTRLFHFADVPDAAAAAPSLQGYSRANWYKELQKAGFGPPTGGPQPGKGGSLKVLTTRLAPGYLRTNGVPYSEKATTLEFFDRVDDDGVSYLVLTSVVQDPTYLSDQYVTSYEFKLERDAAKWNPQPCRIIPPRGVAIPINPFSGRPD
jgi:hypothetical protein